MSEFVVRVQFDRFSSPEPSSTENQTKTAFNGELNGLFGSGLVGVPDREPAAETGAGKTENMSCPDPQIMWGLWNNVLKEGGQVIYVEFNGTPLVLAIVVSSFDKLHRLEYFQWHKKVVFWSPDIII